MNYACTRGRVPAAILFYGIVKYGLATMSPSDQLRLGSLAYWALLALSTMPDHTSHAYALLQEFSKQFGRQPSSAALYQALRQLVRRELIEDAGLHPSSKGPELRLFTLTAAGRQVALDEAASLERISSAVQSSLNPSADKEESLR